MGGRVNFVPVDGAAVGDKTSAGSAARVATSTRRFEFEEFSAPTTSTISHFGAICFTAFWRLVVA